MITFLLGDGQVFPFPFQPIPIDEIHFGACFMHVALLSAQCSAGRTRNLQLDPHPTERALRPKQLLLLSFLIFSYFGAPMSKREEVE